MSSGVVVLEEVGILLICAPNSFFKLHAQQAA